MSTKVRTICVDTVTQIQENQYNAEKRKPGHDTWKDYGTELWNFLTELQKMGFELILVLGPPGTGKSFGMKTLPSKTNIWLNVDNKNPTWVGGLTEYGNKNNPILPYHLVPETYQDMLNHIKAGLEKGMFEDNRFAFITGHLENYKEGADTRVRLKTLGKLNTKMQIEGKLETVLYSMVDMSEGSPKYLLETQNNGYNTARSFENMFEGRINNDYNYIIENLLKRE